MFGLISALDESPQMQCFAAQVGPAGLTSAGGAAPAAALRAGGRKDVPLSLVLSCAALCCAAPHCASVFAFGKSQLQRDALYLCVFACVCLRWVTAQLVIGFQFVLQVKLNPCAPKRT